MVEMKQLRMKNKSVLGSLLFILTIILSIGSQMWLIVNAAPIDGLALATTTTTTTGPVTVSVTSLTTTTAGATLLIIEQKVIVVTVLLTIIIIVQV